MVLVQAFIWRKHLHRVIQVGQELALNVSNWPRGYKTFFMLISTEHEIFPAHKC